MSIITDIKKSSLLMRKDDACCVSGSHDSKMQYEAPVHTITN